VTDAARRRSKAALDVVSNKEPVGSEDNVDVVSREEEEEAEEDCGCCHRIDKKALRASFTQSGKPFFSASAFDFFALFFFGFDTRLRFFFVLGELVTLSTAADEDEDVFGASSITSEVKSIDTTVSIFARR